MPSHIDDLPPPPTSADQTNFVSRADLFVAAFAAFVAQANTLTDEVNANAIAASAAAVTAVNAPGTGGTSATSLTVGIGAGALITQTGKNWQVGNWLTIAQTSNPTNWMVGIVTAYNSGTGALSFNIVGVNGGVTATDWTLGLSAPSVLMAALTAQIWAGTSNNVALTPAGMFAAAAPVAVADAATITLNLSQGLNWAIASFGGNRTLANPTNQKAGQSGVIAISQDATGNRTLGFGSNWKFPGGAPSITATPGATDLISYYVLNPGVILAVLSRAFG